MKLSFELALSYLNKQRGRTIALITSIALAVILVFTLNVIPETQSELNIKEAYKNFSDYHVEYTNLNKDTVEKLSNDKDVREIESTLNLGNIVDENGISIRLNSYNEKFIDSYGYKLIKGENPKNEKEIVLEEKALKEMGLTNELNQILDFTVIKEYVDDNDKNQIYSKGIKLKLVGIVQKPDGYYEGNEYYNVKGFINANENNNILQKYLVEFNGILKFEDEKPNMSMAYKKINQYGMNNYDFMLNASLSQVLDDYEMSRNTNFSRNNKLIPMVAAGLVIYNIFNIILIEMTKQIGMLRAIGLSKKKINLMLLIQGLIVLIVGLVIGFIIGGLFSVIGLSVIYKNIIQLHISKTSIMEPIMMATISVSLSMVFIIIKSNKISPIEAIRFTNKSKKQSKDRFYHNFIRKVFGLTSEMAFKNIFRNKSRTILSVLSISLAGMLFISKMAIYNNEDTNDTSMIITTMGDVDVVLGKDSRNTYESLTYYSEDDIEEISKIKDVSSIEKSMNSTGYLNTTNNALNEDYKNRFKLNTDKENIELVSKIKGYDEKGLESLDKFIESGSNIINAPSGEYPSALISNYYYSPSGITNDTKTLKEVKINDIMEIKIPVNEDGKLKYINQKVQVKGILNKEYVIEHNGGMGGTVQVILNDDEFKNISKSPGYNNLALKVDKDSDEKVVAQIEDIIEDSSFVDIESKAKHREQFSSQDEKNKRIVLVSVILTLLISAINIICIIRTNIIIRTNEISTLRAIGMSTKKVKNMIIKESIIYAILSIVVASIISSIEYYKFISIVNFTQEQGLGKEDVATFSIPVIEIMQFSIVTIIICLVAVHLSKNKIEKLSIVEGLRDNE